MSWIGKSEYDEYLATLDPYLKSLGAGEKFHEHDPWAKDRVWVGMVKFPSGLWFQTWPKPTGAILHLWGEMDLPFYGFEDAGDLACYAAESCGYLAKVSREEQTIEVWGTEEGQHHIVRFEDDRIVNVIRGESCSLCERRCAANQAS